MPHDKNPLVPPPEPGPSTPVKVSPEDFHRVARDFVQGQNRIQRVYGTLNNQLRALTGAAGHDDPARKFAETYTPAAQAVFRGLVRVHRLIGAIAQGLAQSGTAHHRADANSAGVLADPFPIVPTTCPAEVEPASVVGDGDTSVIASVADFITPYYPGGSIPKMHQLADAYEHAHTELVDIASELHAKLQSLTSNNESEDLRALEGFWQRVAGTRDGTLLSTLPQTCAALAKGCAEYASAIEHTREKIHDILEEAALELAGVGIVIAAGYFLTTPAGGTAIAESGGGAVLTAITGRLAAVAGELLIGLGSAAALGATVQATGALTMAINNTPDPNVDQTGSTQPGGQAGEPRPMDAQSVRDVYNQLPRGKSKYVRTVGSDEELQAVYDKMTVGGEPVHAGSYPGKWTRLPDGTRVGIREKSTSGGRTIDIRWGDGRPGAKIHVAGN